MYSLQHCVDHRPQTSLYINVIQMVDIAEKSNPAGPRSVRLLASWARAAHGQPLGFYYKAKASAKRRNCLLIGCCICVVIGSFSTEIRLLIIELSLPHLCSRTSVFRRRCTTTVWLRYTFLR